MNNMNIHQFACLFDTLSETDIKLLLLLSSGGEFSDDMEDTPNFDSLEARGLIFPVMAGEVQGYVATKLGQLCAAASSIGIYGNM